MTYVGVCGDACGPPVLDDAPLPPPPLPPQLLTGTPPPPKPSKCTDEDDDDDVEDVDDAGIMVLPPGPVADNIESPGLRFYSEIIFN